MSKILIKKAAVSKKTASIKKSVVSKSTKASESLKFLPGEKWAELNLPGIKTDKGEKKFITEIAVNDLVMFGGKQQ